MQIQLPNTKYFFQFETVLENKPGHLYTITVTDISKDDQIATGSWDGTVRLYSENGQKSVLFFFKEPIEGLKFSPNGRFLAVGIESEIHIFDFVNNQSFRILPNIQGIRGAVFTWSDDSSKLACVTFDSIIRIYDLETQNEFGCIYDVPTLGGNQISWKMNILAIGLNTGQIALYNTNLPTLKLIGFLEGHTDIVNSVIFSKRDMDLRLYSVSADNTTRSWDLNNNNKMTLLHIHHSSLIHITLSQANPSNILVVCAENETLIFKEDVFRFQIPLQHSSSCNAALNSLANKFVRGINDHDLGIFSIYEQRMISQLDGKYDNINSAKLILNHELIYASNDKDIHIIDLFTGTESLLTGHKESISSLAISHNNKLLVSAGYDDTLRLWDLQSKRQLNILSNSADLPNCVLFNPNDSIVYSTSGTDFTVRGFQVDGTHIFSKTIHEDYINKMISYKDGYFSASDDKTIVFWDNSDNKVFAKADSEVTCLAVSNNNNLLAYGTNKGIIFVLDIVTAKKRFELKTPKRINCLTFSPDDSLLLFGSHTAVNIFNTGNGLTTNIFNLIEPCREVFWISPSNKDSISELIIISVAREVILGKQIPLEQLTHQTVPVDKTKLDTTIPGLVFPKKRNLNAGENINGPKLVPVLESEPKQMPIEKTEPEFQKQPGMTPIPILMEKEGKTDILDSKVQHALRSNENNKIYNKEDKKQPINASDLGRMISQEFIETLKKFDEIQELILSNPKIDNEVFKSVLNRINRLKPVINDMINEIEFILD